MKWTTVEAISTAVAALFTGFGLWYAHRANRLSKESNKLSKDAIKISKESNTISREANAISAKSLEVAKRSELTRFGVKVKSIVFDNDAGLQPTIDEALRIGRISCGFVVENLTKNDALFLAVESTEKSTDLRTEGEKCNGGKTVDLSYNFAADDLISIEPIGKYSNGQAHMRTLHKRLYMKTVYLKWDNGTYNCSCELSFEIVVEEYEDNNMIVCRATCSENLDCKTDHYKMECVY